ncbi:enoyl-CoA hydratase/isomerase family protein [Marinobacter sp.]|uniref:enoyl-CoA hydratase/isomerase family protein n=1 Tax=Marinobacter sp. TaxID=50741 RepID=UPI003B51E0A8
MSNHPVVFEEHGTAGGKKIGVARLNQPKSLNALTLEMIRMLKPQLERWQEDKNIAAVWLEGVGEKAFCAGGDVVFLYESMINKHRLNDGISFFTEEYELDYLIHRYRKPLIVWGNGFVMGGGLGLMAGASHRVATEASRVAMPEITIGLYPDVGVSWFLSRMPGRTGLFIGLTGIHLNAKDARFVGLADRCIQHSLRDTVMEAITSDNSLASDPGACIDAHLRDAEDRSQSVMAPSVIREEYDTIDSLTDATSLSVIHKQITGYKGESKPLQKAASTLAAGSPTSAALVWRQYQECRYNSLLEVFEKERKLSLRCLEKGEMAEGVRALLIDKDKQPRWRYASIEDLEPSWINNFYE